jgi:hypothetical protein
LSYFSYLSYPYPPSSKLKIEKVLQTPPVDPQSLSLSSEYLEHRNFHFNFDFSDHGVGLELGRQKAEKRNILPQIAEMTMWSRGRELEDQGFFSPGRCPDEDFDTNFKRISRKSLNNGFLGLLL